MSEVHPGIEQFEVQSTWACRQSSPGLVGLGSTSRVSRPPGGGRFVSRDGRFGAFPVACTGDWRSLLRRIGIPMARIAGAR